MLPETSSFFIHGVKLHLQMRQTAERLELSQAWGKCSSFREKESET